jgi:hypothetical protein
MIQVTMQVTMQEWHVITALKSFQGIGHAMTYDDIAIKCNLGSRLQAWRLVNCLKANGVVTLRRRHGFEAITLNPVQVGVAP